MEKDILELSPEYLISQGYKKDVNLYIKHREDMDDICVIHSVKRGLFIATIFQSVDQSFRRIVKDFNDLILFEIVTSKPSPSDEDYCDYID